MSEFSDRPERSFGFKPMPGRRPVGGWEIICEICGIVCRTKEDDSLAFCKYVARANGWKGSKNDKKAWRCPEHLKTPIQEMA